MRRRDTENGTNAHRNALGANRKTGAPRPKRSRLRLLGALTAFGLFGAAPLTASPDTGPPPRNDGTAESAADWRANPPRVYIARTASFRTDPSQERIDALAEAGFTVFGHRWVKISKDGIGRESIETMASKCAAAGLDYVPWMRGSVGGQPENPDHRFVWENGAAQPLHGPLSPVLWSYLERSLTYLAELSRDSVCAGAFLDFENYTKGKQANLYYVSFDRHSLVLFARDKGLAEPPKDLAPGEGPEWLAERGLRADFEQWQEAAFRRRLRGLRERVDAINPEFVIGVYAGAGMVNWNLGALATKDAPVAVLSAATYGRSSALLNQRRNLESNRNILRQRMAVLRDADFPFSLLGGVLPGHRGADPEFNAKNMSGIASVADGLWVWDEAGDAEAMAWMAVANREIAAGRSRLHFEPRLDREPVITRFDPPETDRSVIGILGERGGKLTALLEDTGRYHPVTLESLHPDYLKGFDLILLQGFKGALQRGSRLHETLRRFVRDGDSVLFSHRTGRFLESPFPGIATLGRPENRVLAGLQVADTRMVAQERAKAWLGLEAAADEWPAPYRSGFSDHVIFEEGSKGTVLVRNHFGRPVFVAGEHGAGRVAFAGNFFGYAAPPEGMERAVFLGLVDWLAKTEDSETAGK